MQRTGSGTVRERGCRRPDIPWRPASGQAVDRSVGSAGGRILPGPAGEGVGTIDFSPNIQVDARGQDGPGRRGGGLQPADVLTNPTPTTTSPTPASTFPVNRSSPSAADASRVNTG